MRAMRIVLGISMLLILAELSAQPVKCVDRSGKVRYVEKGLVGQENCQPVREGMNVVGPQQGAAPAAPKPPAKPAGPDYAERVALAQRQLDEARQKLAEQESIRLGGERNYARVEERLAPYRQAVEAAQKNLEQVRSER